MINLRILVMPMLALSVIASCKNGKENNVVEDKRHSDSTVVSTLTPPDTPSTDTAAYDINSLPVSEKDLGSFPFFSLSEGLKSPNKPLQRDYDVLFIPLKDKMVSVEGKVWKSTMTAASGNYSDFSLAFFEKSYDEAIKAAGGVKVFDGEISSEQYEVFRKGGGAGAEGAIGFPSEKMKLYVIRRKDGGDIYIQIAGNSAGGKVNILQKEPFKQTITILRSDEIKKELDEKGTAVLYINFDTDKATLQPDGAQAVTEISKLMKAENDLKLAIKGYTDNTGNDASNLQLSKQRAATVMTEIVHAGIDKQRLTSAGYGSANPIADNNTSDGKAKNRRVELVKM